MDESYAVNNDTNRKNGCGKIIGLGVTHCSFSNKKLNTKSSTEIDPVGISDCVLYNTWYIMFMHNQGYLNNSNNVFQDNLSAMRTEMNGRKYCTHHILLNK